MPSTPRNRLGDLERAVMEELWNTTDAHPEGRTVREVHDSIGVDRGLAYTTLMTVLDRMAKKDLVQRERDGRAWRYTPASTEASPTRPS
jgi:predicted transcriptional regulator